MQSGQILLSNSSVWIMNPQTELLTLDAENSPNPVHIKLPDNTGWSIYMVLTAINVSNGNFIISTMRQYLYRKSSGIQLIANEYDITDLSSYGTYTIRPVWDYTTDPDEFRLSITIDSVPSGMVAPSDAMKFVAEIHYTQIR